MLGGRRQKTFHDPTKQVKDSATKQGHAEQKRKRNEVSVIAGCTRVKRNKAKRHYQQSAHNRDTSPNRLIRFNPFW
jgi:hypothetical protein